MAKMNIKKGAKGGKTAISAKKSKTRAIKVVKNTSPRIVDTQKETGIAAKVKPLADRILIKEIEVVTTETTTKSGIFIPVSTNEDKSSKHGTVVAIGMGRYDDGILIPPQVKIGDQVIFGWGDKIKVDGEEYYLVREAEIMAVLK